MEEFEILDPRFRSYVLPNGPQAQSVV